MPLGARAVHASVILGATVALLGACSGSAAGPVELVEGVEVPVDAIDNSFRLAEITVAPGTEVVWTNRGRSDHDILPVDEGSFGVDEAQFGPDATYRYRFTEPGEFAYFCSLHGTNTKGMVGKVIVRAG